MNIEDIEEKLEQGYDLYFLLTKDNEEINYYINGKGDEIKKCLISIFEHNHSMAEIFLSASKKFIENL